MVSTGMSFLTKVLSGNDLSLLPESTRNQIQQLDQKLMDYDWTDQQWQELWESPGPYSLALLENKGIKGFSLWMHSDHWELLKITIIPELRGSGIAAKFFQQTTDQLKAKKVFLEVSTKSPVAVGFYQKLGFETLNEVNSYYRDKSNCLKMVLNIND